MPARWFTAKTSEFDNAHIARGPWPGQDGSGGQKDNEKLVRWIVAGRRGGVSGRGDWVDVP